MEALFENLKISDDEVKDLEKLFAECTLETSVNELVAMTKKLKIKWTKHMKAAYNKQKKTCDICGSSTTRGNWAKHKTTRRHKKAARKIKKAKRLESKAVAESRSDQKH